MEEQNDLEDDVVTFMWKDLRQMFDDFEGNKMPDFLDTPKKYEIILNKRHTVRSFRWFLEDVMYATEDFDDDYHSFAAALGCYFAKHFTIIRKRNNIRNIRKNRINFWDVLEKFF